MLGTLPPLTDIGTALKQDAVAIGVSAVTGGAVPAAVSGAASAGNGSASGSAGGFGLTNYVMIAIGILLIAAGIFQFDKARAIIVKARKTATETAAAAA